MLAIDAGTTGITLCKYNRQGEVLAKVYSEFPQYYPKPGWVEHSGQEIWDTTVKLLREIGLEDVEAMGITNQRETVLAWDKETSQPLYNAIVWQCRRTASRCQELSSEKDRIRKKTGLVLDAYFSATKMEWLLQNVEAVRKTAEAGRLAFGTIDSWLLWKLTGGKVHGTDYTNASRTMVYNIHAKEWDDELLNLFSIPKNSLPSVYPSAYSFGETEPSLFGVSIPITGIAGDQQAALFGQKCVEPGEFKNTYGTGCFLLLHTGKDPVDSHYGLLTTLTCDREGKAAYGLEGSIFIAGALIQWLRDGLGLIQTAQETEELAFSVSDTGGVHILPALVGMGAPYWNMNVRGAILGLTRGTTKAHISRAALESIAYQTKALVDAIAKDCSFPLTKLRVDGGATSNKFLMQFQADILQMDVIRPQNIESTALGAAYLAGLGSGFWKDFETILNLPESKTSFTPKMNKEESKRLYDQWQKAVEPLLLEKPSQ
ncbi:MAG: glycerol kinase [Planctomycetota bacterium]|nr:MAG: glycerol kinase [Planctomycetota bacterium]